MYSDNQSFNTHPLITQENPIAQKSSKENNMIEGDFICKI